MPTVDIFFILLNFCFLRLDFHLLMLDIQAKVVVNAHVLIGNPHQSEKGNEIAAPIGVEQFEAGDNKKSRRNIVAETVFAGKQIKKLLARK